jgi:hypothetical protein
MSPNTDKKEFFRNYSSLLTDNDVLSFVHYVNKEIGRVNPTESKSFFAIVVIASLVVGLVVVIPFLTNPTGTDNVEKWNQPTSQVQYLTIQGNSSDIIYPELMEAVFEFQSSGEYNVSAHFVDDSISPYDLEIYDLSFKSTQAEMDSIIDALYTGLNDTVQSSDSISTIWDQGNMGYEVDVTFTDGTWIYILTIQSPKGHIIFLNGTSEHHNTNLLDGILLEPASALDPFVIVLNAIFSEHLD